MLKRFIIFAIVISSLILPALASSDRDDDIFRMRAFARVFREIMRAPDRGIPRELLESTKCVAIVPGENKAAFIVGASYGRGWRRVERRIDAPLCSPPLVEGAGACKLGAPQLTLS